MTKRDYENLFDKIKPDFFNRDYIRNRSDDSVFEEMILSLKDFDITKYSKSFGPEISFGYFDGDLADLKNQVKKVDESWTEFFDGSQKIFCGYIDGKVASFCLIEDFGTFEFDGKMAKFGGPGCVGTVPEFRSNGIGLTMVNRATQILKELGYDYSYIHYTGVVGWYAKLGYQTILKWNRNGFVS